MTGTKIQNRPWFFFRADKTRVLNFRTKARVSVVCAFVLFYFSCFGICRSVFAQDKIVAIVNNDIVTQKDLNEFLNFMRIQLRQEYSGRELESKIQSMKLDLINKLIEDRLILQEAKKYGIISDENRIRAKVDETRRHYPTEADFENALKQQGMVRADLEAKIREQFLMYNVIEYKVRSKITVMPTEVTEFYQTHPEEFNLGEARVFDSVGFPDLAVARDFYAALKKSKSMEETAQKYGMEINRLDVSRSGELKKEIEDVVFSLGAGDFSEPADINGKYYIFKLVSISPSRILSLDEARDKIYTYLFNKKMEKELSDWLEGLKKHSYIKLIND